MALAIRLCSFTLTVMDNQVPVVTCPVVGNTNRNTNNNLCTWVSPNTNLDATATTTALDKQWLIF